MLRILSRPAAALDWLGRQGTRGVAVSIFGGLILPQLAATLKPVLPEAIFLLLVLAFLRVEPRALRGYLARPGLILLATIWLMVVVPALLAIGLRVAGLDAAMPGLYLALVLQAAGAPVMSAPAFSALMGLDPALALALLMLCMLVNPLTTPVFAHFFGGASLAIAPVALGLKLALLMGGSAAFAFALRRLIGSERIARHKLRIDGLNVVVLFVFAIAVMDGVGAHFLQSPALVLGLVVLAFAVALASLAATMAAFRRIGVALAMTIGFSAACRNLGVTLAAAGGALPDQAWLYFGLAQFPIYLLPQLLLPLARRITPEQERT